MEISLEEINKKIEKAEKIAKKISEYLYERKLTNEEVEIILNCIQQNIDMKKLKVELEFDKQDYLPIADK